MINIIYQDSDLLIIDKPPNLVVDQSITQKEPTLAEILIKDYGIKLKRGGIVHRLDKDTSGVLVVAKTQEALDSLQSQFKSRVVKKEYIALVHGSLVEERKVDAPIARNLKNREKFTTSFQGKEAITIIKPISNFKFTISNFQSIFSDLNKNQKRKLEKSNYNSFTLVRCYPLTGRTHQIRVHLKYINLSIVGDEKYGGRKIARLDHRWCQRQFLHAARIEFKHPGSGDWIVFESKLPEDLEKALKCLSELASQL